MILKGMKKYRVVRHLKAEDAAYLAGLVDGEGTITLTSDHPGEKRCIVLSISNTDRALLEFVREVVGAGTISTKRVYSDRHTPSFAYRVTNRQALDVLSQIVRYLKTYRASRAEMALSRYIPLTPRNGKYTDALLALRNQFERAFLAIGPGPRSRVRPG